MPRINRRQQNVVNNFPPFPAGFSRFRQHHQHTPETSTTTSSSTTTKANPRFLSLLLQALIMAFIISLFFIFVGVAAIIFIHLCIAGGALHRRHRRHNNHQSHHRPISEDGESSSGYSSDDLNSLPKSSFHGGETTNCAICLDNLLDGETCRVLPACKHVFHLDCVDKWLSKVPACPVCRGCVRLEKNKNPKKIGDHRIDWEHLWAAYGFHGCPELAVHLEVLAESANSLGSATI